jgi:RNA polymerase sporulation-specific sigma factor
LLYLIEEGNEVAKDIMLKKYENLIKSKISRFNIHYSQYEDFYQEGCLVLLEAIHKFDVKYGKSFTRFFELLLVRKFLTLLKKLNKPVVTLSEEIISTIRVEEEEPIYMTEKHLVIAREELTEVEYDVFFEHYVRNKKIKEICAKYLLPEKKVYNALYRIKLKLRRFKELS